MKTVKTTLMTLTAVAVVGWIGYRFYQAYQPEPVTLQGQIESQQYSISSKCRGALTKFGAQGRSSGKRPTDLHSTQP